MTDFLNIGLWHTEEKVTTSFRSSACDLGAKWAQIIPSHPFFPRGRWRITTEKTQIKQKNEWPHHQLNHMDLKSCNVHGQWDVDPFIAARIMLKLTTSQLIKVSAKAHDRLRHTPFFPRRDGSVVQWFRSAEPVAMELGCNQEKICANNTWYRWFELDVIYVMMLME